MSSPVSPVTPYQASPTSPSLGELPSPIIDDQTSAEHTIDIGKIQCGEDLRTTVCVSVLLLSILTNQFLIFSFLFIQIMIRNIPNKITSVPFLFFFPSLLFFFTYN
jgi:hypothetical protein